MIRKLDNQALRAADVAVLSIWNRLRVPRIVQLRILTIGWVVVYSGYPAMIGKAGLGLVFLDIVILTCQGFEEIKTARMSPRLRNLLEIASRSSPLAFWSRMIALSMFASIVLIGMFSTGPIDVIFGLFAIADSYLNRSLSPEGPPKPPRKVERAPLRTALQGAS